MGGGGGGGRNRLCACDTKPEVPYSCCRGPGLAYNLRALEALGVFDTLSCYLSLVFKHSDTKLDNKKQNSRSWGEGCCALSKSASEIYQLK